jgi:hypothetical protein
MSIAGKISFYKKLQLEIIKLKYIKSIDYIIFEAKNNKKKNYSTTEGNE